MSQRTASIRRLVATALTAATLAATVSGCGFGGDLDSLASNALKHTTKISQELEEASEPASKVVSDAERSRIANDIAQFKAAPSLSTDEHADEVRLKNYLAYENTVAATTSLANQELKQLNSDVFVIVKASVNTGISSNFEDALKSAARAVLKATVCQTAQTLLSTPEADRLKNLSLTVDYSAADALQNIPATDLLEFIYKNYLTGFIPEDVQKVFSAAAFAKSVSDEVQAIKTGITGIQQSNDAATTTGWIFYIRYCTT